MTFFRNSLRKLTLCFLVVFAGSHFQPAISAVETDASRINVLLICVDDLKPLLGCYGDAHAKTPNIDRLAMRALRLNRAYCNQAVCSPSRNALMTSLRPQTLGIYDLATNFRDSRPDAITLAQYFQKHGYRTEALGKIFHPGHGNHEDDASWTVPHFRPKANQYALPENRPPENRTDAENRNQKKARNSDPKGTATESADVADTQYSDGQIAAEAVRRIKAAAASDEPFLIAVGFLKPHLPFVAPQKYWDLHDPSTLPQPVRLTPPDNAPLLAPTNSGELRAYRGIPAAPETISAETTRHLIHGYYAATSFMDAQVGKVLDALDQSGLDDSTIVVLWGDHGWHLGDHGMWCKHTNYEQAARIPLLIARPEGHASVSDALVETVDLYPTLAQLAGLPSPEGLEGQSFAHLFENPQAQHRDHVIHVYPRNKRLGRAIRTNRYRMVEWKEFGGTEDAAVFELYDYESDPDETKNLADSSPDVLNELRSLLRQHPEARPQLKASK